MELGISFGTVKSLLIFFGPILLPRAINYYRTLRVSIAHRPPPRPLPHQANRALNILFAAIVLFFLLSLPFNPHAPFPNIFKQTKSRINTPTDVIFARLARLRPGNNLTEFDIALRSKLTSQAAKKAYLRFGPDALVSCQFCSPEQIESYLLYFLPSKIFVPHLFHLLILGVVTTASLTGPDAGRWRNTFTVAGVALAAIDTYLVVTYDPWKTASAAVRAGQAPPSSSYAQLSLLRPLAFAIFDGICALIIYATATHRFFFRPPSQAEQVDQLVANARTALSGATSKLHALSVTRNAVVREPALKARDDEYWRTVVAMDGADAGGGGTQSELGNIWEQPEVVRAMARTMSGHAGPLATLGTSANEYVNKITAGLEDVDEQTSQG